MFKMTTSSFYSTSTPARCLLLELAIVLLTESGGNVSETD